MNKLVFKRAQCRVIAYDWDVKTPADDASEFDLAKTTRLYLSKHILATSFSKNLASPSGTFEITMDNSRDWRKVVRRDTWCTIYLSNEEVLAFDKIPDPKFSRGMCYIERIAERVVEQEDGSQDVTYVITGKDYGKIYEETEIWQNYFKFEKTLAETLTSTLSLDNVVTTDKLIELGHKLFFSSKSDIKGGASISEIAQQWLLPDNLLRDLKLNIRPGTRGSYFGNINGLFQFSLTNTTIPISNPLASINGNAWAKLKEWSVEPLNELFPELNTAGIPELIYRPIPWGLNAKGYPSLKANIKSYRDLITDSDISIGDEEITFVDVGEDSHNRYNHFFAWSSANRHSQFDNISELADKRTATGREFPYVRHASVLRHGFKPMHTELNTITYSVKNTKNGAVNTKLLLEYNEVMYDYWSPAVYFESGSVTILGRNDIKVGKAVMFKDGSRGKLSGKAFYIEGYQDEYIVEEDGSQTWFQTLQLTRGIKASHLNENLTTAELEDKIESDIDSNPAEEVKGTFIED